MKLGLRLAAVMAVVALAGSSVAVAQDYPIKLNRPEKVGNEFRMAAVGNQTSTTTIKMDGKALEPQNQAVAVTFNAAVKVLEVNKNGEPSKMTLTVEKLSVKQGGAAAADALPKGAVITASVKGGKSAFEVAGKAVEPETAAALDLVVSLGQGGASDDEVYGTKDRKKMGDQWSMNSELAAKDAAKQDITVSKENITGTVKLDKTEKVGGVDCLVLSMHTAPRRSPRPCLRVSRSRMDRWRLARCRNFPSNPAARTLEDSMDMTMRIAAKGKPDPQGPEMAIDSAVKMSRSVKFSPL